MDEAMVIPCNSSKKELNINGKHLSLLFKSGKMEGILIEVEPGKEFGKQFSHDGEEIHFILEGAIEYLIGDKTYKLSKGDCLWHKSIIPHSARNPSSKKAIYLTIGVPPTFM